MITRSWNDLLVEPARRAPAADPVPPGWPQYQPPAWAGYQQPASPQGPHGLPFPLADRGGRLGARVLDTSFWYLGYGIIAVPAMLLTRGTEAEDTVLPLVLAVWLPLSYLLYFP